MIFISWYLYKENTELAKLCNLVKRQKSSNYKEKLLFVTAPIYRDTHFFKKSTYMFEWQPRVYLTLCFLQKR